MKRCPECRRDYYDDTLYYCLDDGNALLEGPASGSEPATAIFPSSDLTLARTAFYSDPELEIPSRSIAVLPFVHLSSDPDDEYFCDGLAEELLNALARIEGLKVAARTSAFSFKGKNIKISEIAEALHVSTVLEGSVRKAGERIRISVQLVNAADGFHLWSERYDREMKGIFDVQDEITLAVVDALKVELFGENRAAALERFTDDSEAYELYLKGRYHWNRRTAENLQKAIGEFKAAIDRDPNYALAYAGLADCYAILPEYAGTPGNETARLARDFASRAIAINDRLAEPHAALGLVAEQLWDWDEAERAYKRAIELNPNHATAFLWYSILLKNLGRYDEAEGMIMRAARIEPLSGAIGCNISMIHQVLNDHEACIENALKMIELDPTFGRAYEYLGLSYRKLGREDEAVKMMEKAVELTNRQNVVLSELGYVYGRAGHRDKALAIAKELEEKYDLKRAAGHEVAAVYSGLGDNDKAFEWLERDLQSKEGRLKTVRWESQFEPLRDDPRFLGVLRRMNMPE